MIRANDKVLSAFATLESNPDFQTLMQEYFIPSLQEADKQNRVLDGPKLHQNQGAAQTLEIIIENTEKAHDWLKERRINQQK